MGTTASREELPAGMPEPGSLFVGKYRIDDVLGVGGMGVVYLALHVHLQERVALKLLRPECADPQLVERFVREGRAAVKIRSAHIARVHDVGTDERGLPYLVLDYLEGSDLADSLGQLPIPVCVDYVVQACDALAHAHAAGIVHRDLKPSNLFAATTEDGIVVKVIDFGIAKAAATEEPGTMALTKTQGTMGSPLYMSPEQVRCLKDVDARTDIWSLGVVLHELVTGTPPFDGPTLPALAAAITADIPHTMRATREDVPRELDDIVGRCLEKSPDARFATVLELAEALAPFGTEETPGRIPRIARAGHGSDPKLAAGRGSDPRLPSRQSDPRLPVSSRRVPAQTVPLGPLSSGSYRSGEPVGPASAPTPPSSALRPPLDAPSRQTSSAWGGSADEKKTRTMTFAFGGAALLAVVGIVLGAVALRDPPADPGKGAASAPPEPTDVIASADPSARAPTTGLVPGVDPTAPAPPASATGATSTASTPVTAATQVRKPLPSARPSASIPAPPALSSPPSPPADSSGLLRNRHGN
ncbi:MAG: protein kinase [Labilithrix sp.]|nr:protein kinase [Labilithrix sp.]